MEWVWWGWSLVEMKIISYNVRGLGGFDKREEFNRFIRVKHPFVVWLQESKLSVVDDFIITSLWGSVGCGFSYQASIGAFGGLITI